LDDQADYPGGARGINNAFHIIHRDRVQHSISLAVMLLEELRSASRLTVLPIVCRQE
jgi:hypothetical protein